MQYDLPTHYEDWENNYLIWREKLKDYAEIKDYDDYLEKLRSKKSDSDSPTA